MKATRAFLRALVCAVVFCGYAVPYTLMDDPGATWPVFRVVTAALVAAILIGVIAVKFGWPVHWRQFGMAVIVGQVVVACMLEWGARQLQRHNKPSAGAGFQVGSVESCDTRVTQGVSLYNEQQIMY